MSAIKSVLRADGYLWDDNVVLLHSLIRACKLINDRVTCHLPIQSGLMKMLIFEVERLYGGKQCYLESLYKALFVLAYYGLMRIGKLIESEHTLKANDIHVGMNKNKILMVLRSSKTHGKESLPQKIKITAQNNDAEFRKHRFFCPFSLVRNFLHMQGDYDFDNEFLFIFSGGQAVTQCNVREVLKTLLLDLNLDPSLYGFHGFRSGRATDLFKMQYSISEICKIGRWRSSAVYRYLK